MPSRRATDEARGLLRLSDAAKKAGVTAQQLNYYLMVGLIEPTETSAGKQRLFDHRAIKKIRMVQLLNQSGYSLRDIRDIFLHRTRSR
jgi:DNA-binding transcriptional MerR regulator